MENSRTENWTKANRKLNKFLATEKPPDPYEHTQITYVRMVGGSFSGWLHISFFFSFFFCFFFVLFWFSATISSGADPIFYYLLFLFFFGYCCCLFSSRSLERPSPFAQPLELLNSPGISKFCSWAKRNEALFLPSLLKYAHFSIHIHPSIRPSVHPSIHPFIHIYIYTYIVGPIRIRNRIPGLPDCFHNLPKKWRKKREKQKYLL